MAHEQSIAIREVLSSVISPGHLARTAREEGFVTRSRKVKPAAFFWTLVLGFGAGSEKSLASLRRCYALHTGTALAPSAFYDRFTPGLVRWLRRLLLEVLERSAEPARALRGRLSSFIDLVAVDGTVVRLHDMLAQSFPACRTNHTKAAAKLTVVMSVLGKGARTVRISPERRHDSTLLTVGSWVKGRLLLFDLGYYRYSLFERIDAYGGFFVTRLKTNANPVIVRTLGGAGGRRLEGQSLQSALLGLRRPVLDAVVRLSYKNKRGRLVTGLFRLAAVRHPETKRYHLYITNVPAERLSAAEIAQVYTLRWEIEILFRQLKTRFRLEDIPSANADAVHALLYATLITLAVSKAFLHALHRRYPENAGRMPNERWTVFFTVLAPVLLAFVLAGRRGAKRRHGDILAVMRAEAIDPNKTREGGKLRLLEGYAT